MRDSNQISSQYFTNDQLVAEAFAVKGAAGPIWTTRLYQDGCEVANLTYDTFNEADEVATKWSWSH